MAYNLAPLFKQRFFNTNGDPLAGGKLYTYQSGTTTPQATYVASGGAANANPIILDANGEANVWLDQSLSYKFILKDSTDVTQWTVDSVIGTLVNDAVSTSSIQDLAVTTAKMADANVTRAKLATGAVASNSWTASKTSTYAITTSDDTIRCDVSGGGFTVTLPTAVGAQGRRYKIIQTGALSANTLTIATTSSQTINGVTTFVLVTKWEMVEVESDNANWVVTNRYIPSLMAAYTPAITGMGTVASVSFFWRREGDGILVRGTFTSGTPTAVEARIDLPTGLTTAGSTKISSALMIIGKHNGTVSSASFFSAGTMLAEQSKTYVTMGVETSTKNGITKYNGSDFVGIAQAMSVEFKVPIANFEG